MATIPDDLAHRIIEALQGNELGDELRRALTPSNGEAVMHVAVPERFAPHFASALSVGATTAMMCSRSQDAIDALREAAVTVRSTVPRCLGHFLHRSDGERIMDMIVQPGVTIETGRATYGWLSRDVIIRSASGAEFRPRAKDDLDEETAEAIASELRGIAERLGEPAPCPANQDQQNWEP